MNNDQFFCYFVKKDIIIDDQPSHTFNISFDTQVRELYQEADRFVYAIIEFFGIDVTFISFKIILKDLISFDPGSV